MKMKPDRNLAMEMVRITESAAISAARYMGTGDKIAGDQAAVDAMRSVLKSVNIKGTVVIGEGEKDEAPMLYNGEKVGNGNGPEVDVAVDPVEGTNLLAYGRPNSIAVIAMAEAGAMWDPGNSYYMNKLVVEKKAKHVIDITKSVTYNIEAIAKALDRPVRDLTVFVLDKPRHKAMIEEIRNTGARITLHTDGDVLGALMAATPGTGVDVLMGIGGTPEGVIAAAAVKALGGGMQGVRSPQYDNERETLIKDGVNIDEVLDLNDLIKSEDAFFAATGITEGGFLEGVHFDRKSGVTTNSIVIRALTGSVRYIKGIHRFKKSMEFKNREEDIDAIVE